MAKKSFMTSDNPAMQFISATAPETAASASAVDVSAAPGAEPVTAAVQSDASDIFEISPKSSEHKSKRAQLLMTPSLHRKVVKKAASLNMSFNEMVNIVLEKYVQ